MRGKASLASADNRYSRSTTKSLMARLAALQEGVGTQAAKHGPQQAAAHRRRVMRTYFGGGLAASLVIGCAALVPLLYAHPGALRNQGLLDAAHSDLASTRLAVGMGALGQAHRVEVFELPIRNSQRADALFPLPLTDAGPADSIEVVLHNVPETAWLSRGHRRDEHTWVLRPADLDNLRLDLREGTPKAFDVTIEVGSTLALHTTRSVARIRLLDDPQQVTSQVTLVERTATQRSGDLVEARPKQQPGSDTSLARRSTDTTPKQKTVQKPATLPTAKPQTGATEDTTAALPAGTIRLVRPEGMSALGALSREPEPRQLWWKMPLPSWVPFDDAAGRK